MAVPWVRWCSSEDSACGAWSIVPRPVCRQCRRLGQRCTSPRRTDKDADASAAFKATRTVVLSKNEKIVIKFGGKSKVSSEGVGQNGVGNTK